MENAKTVAMDRTVIQVEADRSIEDAILIQAPELMEEALVAKIDGKILDLSVRPEQNTTAEILTSRAPEGLEVLRHSTSHIMASAVKQLFPEAQLTIGPAIENGFYYDFDRLTAFVPEDLALIEETMRKIIEEDIPFERSEMKKDEAIEFFQRRGENYKVEIIRDLDAETVSIYKTGDFVDLCVGPHIPSTKKVKVYKLLNVAGAYWRGDEKRQMLQRIYGTAFPTKEEMEAYLFRTEEAKRRDHRRLGRELDLFSFQEEAGPGLLYWHPRGAMVRKIMEDLWKDEHLRRGYQLVNTPHIAKSDLWRTSGHLEFYKESMYSPMDVEGQEYILKPMNCPFHILIYKTQLRSYKDMPIRYAELGTVYRYERSGVLHGTLRVRGFTQDDAHIFCTPDQLEKEMIDCVEFARFLIETFGFHEYEVDLATRPEKYAGTVEDWDRAESTLARALKERGIAYVRDEGGAVFYGPKIDIKIKDTLGRLWQGPTIQFDFNLPGRFNVTYIGSDGKEHFVYMVHRALYGSLERFMGCLVEHYAGAFPVWLAPLQVRIMTIAERNLPYAEEVRRILGPEGIRTDIDARREKVGFKIREAQVQKIPYMLIVGDTEAQDGLVSVRSRKTGDLGSMSLEGFLAMLRQEIERKVQ